jgi:SAM-dependent methyltransferase
MAIRPLGSRGRRGGEAGRNPRPIAASGVITLMNRMRSIPPPAALLLSCFLLGLPCAAAAQAAGPPRTAPASQPAAAQRPTSEPYTGDLSVFESPGRDQRLQINRVMDVLAISAGKSVADIGAGSGWFAVRAARRVGSAGLVYAVDINPQAVGYIERRVRQENLDNVRPVLSQPDNPALPANSVDAVLFLKAYHEVASPVALLQNLRPALRPGAKVGIIDRNGNGANHGVRRQVVVREAARAGYRLAGSYDFVKDGMDYFLVFTAAP